MSFMDNLILKAFLPEIFLSVAILLQVLFNARHTMSTSQNFPLLSKEIFVQFYFILFIVLSLLLNIRIEGVFSNFLLINDLSAVYLKIIFIVSVCGLFVFIWQSYVDQKLNFFEFFTIFLFSVLASLLLVSCYDLISTYLVLELQALCFYILAGIKRNSTFSTEAALKYFISGSFFSCVFLFGTLILYGELATTNFYIISLLTRLPFDAEFEIMISLLLIGALLVTVTFFFKLALVPFHFWVPDVYEGSPLSSTIILAVLPKIVLFSVLVRFLQVNFSMLKTLEFVFFFIGALSVVWGTINALKQTRMKKLLIFSSIAQFGFVAGALAIFSKDALTAIYFFLIVYTLTAILGWGGYTSVFSFQQQVFLFQKIKMFPIFLSDFVGLFKTNKMWAFIFIIFFFSIAGIPPFVGFLGKFFLFFSMIQGHNFFYVILLVVVSSISTFYYLRVLKLIFFETQVKHKRSTLFSGNFLYLYKDIGSLILMCTLFVLIFFFFYPMNLILISKLITCSFFQL